MRRCRDEVRFEIIDPAARRFAPTRRALSDEGPAIVPVRVIASTAPLARRDAVDDVGCVEVALPDGTRLRFPASVSSSFLVQVVVALRAAPC